jgi:hypothetical protein
VRCENSGEEIVDEAWLEKYTQEHTKRNTHDEWFRPRSIITYIYFFYIAPIRAWSTKLNKASWCTCVLLEEGLS